MSHKRVVINVHIEKTAGTSLLKFFERTIGKNRIAFYDPATDSLSKISDLPFSPSNDLVDKLQLKSYTLWPVLKKVYYSVYGKHNQRNVSLNNIAIIHGHFKADRFDKKYPESFHTVVIRDPLKRMHSQYDHWKRAKGRSQWRVMVPYDSKMTFEEYAMLPVMRNYQTQALAGKDLSEFSVVGITERLGAYTEALYKLFQSEGLITGNVPLNGVEKLNQHKNIHTAKSSGFTKDFETFHKDDYDLYRKAKELAK